MAYNAPVSDMAFALEKMARLSRVEGLEAFENYDAELITPIAMDKELRFAIREGGRTVGAGVVTEIIE